MAVLLGTAGLCAEMPKAFAADNAQNPAAPSCALPSREVSLSQYPLLSQKDPSIYRDPSLASAMDTSANGKTESVQNLACAATVYVMIERGRGNAKSMVDDFYDDPRKKNGNGAGATRPTYVGTDEAWSPSVLIEALQANHPVVLHATGGILADHFMLAVGLNKDSSGNWQVIVSDPWPGNKRNTPGRTVMLPLQPDPPVHPLLSGCTITQLRKISSLIGSSTDSSKKATPPLIGNEVTGGAASATPRNSIPPIPKNSHSNNLSHQSDPTPSPTPNIQSNQSGAEHSYIEGQKEIARQALLQRKIQPQPTPAPLDIPTENQGANAMATIIGKESKGLLRLVRFTKTNGQKSEVNGIKHYMMECEVMVLALEDCAMTGFEGPFGWNGSFYAKRLQKHANELDKYNPFGAEFAGNKQLIRGAQAGFITKLEFDLTERGWRVGWNNQKLLPSDNPFVADMNLPPSKQILAQGDSIPDFTFSPDQQYGVSVPERLDPQNSTGQNKLVCIADRTVLATIEGESGISYTEGKYDHVGKSAWSRDGSTLAWVVDGKWAPLSFSLIQVVNGEVRWKKNILQLAAREGLAQTKAVAPQAYEQVKAEHSGGSWVYPDGFVVDIKAPTAGFTFPISFKVELNSNPKGIPDLTTLCSSLQMQVDVDGKVTFLGFRIEK